MMRALQDRLKDAPALGIVATRGLEIPGLQGRRPVTRFAPSSTGELHLGHVVHALWVWGVAEVLGATVLLRMEDHDRIRCRPEFEHSILADLAWLGFEAEPGSATSLAGRGSPYRQSDVPERYAEAFARLAAATDVYSCSCTRAQLGPADADHERRYPGTCRGMPLDREGRCAIRAHLSEGTVATTDLRLGVLVEDPQATCGDIVVRDALGQWTYQFSVVVDDLFHGVDLVVRGEDLVHSTARQVHHPLVVDPDGRKLSKRDRSLTIRAMREGGKTAAQVIDEAWGLAGLSTVE
jgi:glutamyl-Q tRNA(Asp) synthetase